MHYAIVGLLRYHPNEHYVTSYSYTHWIRAGTGFIPEVDAQLLKEADI